MDCTSRVPRTEGRAARRILQVAIAAGPLCLFVSVAVGAVSGSGMPWEAPLDQLLQSLSGPVARAIGGVAIIGLGIGLALAFNALTWGLSFLGFSGGLCV